MGTDGSTVQKLLNKKKNNFFLKTFQKMKEYSKRNIKKSLLYILGEQTSVYKPKIFVKEAGGLQSGI